MDDFRYIANAYQPREGRFAHGLLECPASQCSLGSCSGETSVPSMSKYSIFVGKQYSEGRLFHVISAGRVQSCPPCPQALVKRGRVTATKWRCSHVAQECE